MKKKKLIIVDQNIRNLCFILRFSVKLLVINAYLLFYLVEFNTYAGLRNQYVALFIDISQFIQ